MLVAAELEWCFVAELEFCDPDLADFEPDPPPVVESTITRTIAATANNDPNAANRVGVEAYHRLNQGVLLAQMGQRREALSLLWRSSARWQVLRLLTGERAWAQLRRLARGEARG